MCEARESGIEPRTLGQLHRCGQDTRLPQYRQAVHGQGDCGHLRNPTTDRQNLLGIDERRERLHVEDRGRRRRARRQLAGDRRAALVVEGAVARVQSYSVITLQTTAAWRGVPDTADTHRAGRDAHLPVYTIPVLFASLMLCGVSLSGSTLGRSSVVWLPESAAWLPGGQGGARCWDVCQTARPFCFVWTARRCRRRGVAARCADPGLVCAG